MNSKNTVDLVIQAGVTSEAEIVELGQSLRGVGDGQRVQQPRGAGPVMIHPDRLAQLRTERDAEEEARTRALDQHRARLQAMHDIGRLLAAEHYSYAQVRELSQSRHYFYRAPTLAPGLNVQTQEEWDAFVDGVSEVAALL